ncbi:MAG: DUF262 domain-containing protein [Desulfobacteraceae bacterium]|nr:MAG: DUF262 domain-containing protein [Desulfobacteraceae bacterium]
MSKISSKVISFSTLKRNFEDCIYAIPQLQRNYVWDKKRVCLLLDSIYNHYPTGIFLIWKAKSNMVAEIRPNNKTILPAFNLNHGRVDFIIDGQQRLTSLYGIIAGINEALDFNSIFDFRKIYFSLNSKNAERFVFLKLYDSARKEYIPVYEVIKNSQNQLKRRFNLNNTQLREITKLKAKIQSYRFFFMYMETDSKDEVEETFIRINSQGMTVSQADALFTKMASIGLRDLVNSTRRALIKRQYNEMKPETFIYTLSLSKGQRTVGKVALRGFVNQFKEDEQLKSDFKDEWKKYHNAFLQTVDFMFENFGITSYYQLPSDNIFTILALFFYLNHGMPSSQQKREIKKWFWHTALGERYSGSRFNRNIPSDIQFFKKLARKKNHKYIITDKINPNDFLRYDYRRTNSSAVLGYYLFLKKLKPRYLEVGYTMMLDDATAHINKKDRHHIFPKALLSRKGISPRWKDSFLNICFLAKKENDYIKDDYPHNYLGEFEKKSFFGSVMKSHLIPAHSSSGVWEQSIGNGFKKFLNQRADLILNNIAKVAAIRRSQLFEKYEEIKRI